MRSNLSMNDERKKTDGLLLLFTVFKTKFSDITSLLLSLLFWLPRFLLSRSSSSGLYSMSTVFLYFALFMVPFTPPYSNSLADLTFISSSTPSPDNLHTTFNPQHTLPVPMNCTQENTYDRMKVEGDPMIYILTMLIVFSAGIASLMIIYMKKVVNFS